MVQRLPFCLVLALHTCGLLDRCHLLHRRYRRFWVASRRETKILRTFQVSFKKSLRSDFPKVLARVFVEEGLCGHESLNGSPLD